MDSKEQIYAAFRENEPGDYCFLSSDSPMTLKAFMERVNSFYAGWEDCRLVAWAAADVDAYTCNVIARESIAAGRLIEKADGKWVAVEDGESSKTPTLDKMEAAVYADLLSGKKTIPFERDRTKPEQKWLDARAKARAEVVAAQAEAEAKRVFPHPGLLTVRPVSVRG